MNIHEVTSRESMVEYFSRRMSSQVDALVLSHELEGGRGLVKSYVIECDAAANTADPPSTWLEKALSPAFRVSQIDSTLYRLAPQSRSQRERRIMFLDTNHKRIWRIHTDAAADESDKMWSRLIRSVPRLDRTWLPTQSLATLATSDIGVLTGATSRFQQRFLESDDEYSRPSLSLKMWGSRAPAALRTLMGSPDLNDSFTLTGLRLRYYGSDDVPAHDDVTFDGKVTCWGRSWQAHEELISHIFEDLYLARTMGALEARFRFSADEEGTTQGEVVQLALSTPLDSIPDFVRQLIATRSSFRLAGVVDVMTEEFARLLAVDQHVAQAITLEVEPTLIRISLKGDGCGNSILRLLALVQQEFDPAAELTDIHGAKVLP